MKISEQELKQIIKEELSKVMGKEEVTEAASLNPFRRSHESGREMAEEDWQVARYTRRRRRRG